jgi:hypothetical protein
VIEARRTALSIAIAVFVLVGVGAFAWHTRHHHAAAVPQASSSDPAPPASDDGDPEKLPTLIHAHNVMLHKGPNFRIYVTWMGGQLRRTNPKVYPSFDKPESFVLEIDKGLIRANIGDISKFLNSDLPPNSPLKNVSLAPDGEDLKLRGTVHKLVPLPVELDGAISPLPDGRIRYHVKKLSVLKLPLKGLMGSFHLQLSDLVNGTGMDGIQIMDNDIIFDTSKLLPPPHIHGRIKEARVRPPDLEVIYGAGEMDQQEIGNWKNFLRLEHGTIDFGKITMHNVDLTMIDTSPENWFDLDLVNYEAQMVNGYTRMTAQAGMEIYMPDASESAPKQPAKPITLEWLKNRNAAPPPDVKLPNAKSK